MSAILQKLKIGKHFGMERFGIILSFLLVCMVIVCIVSITAQNHQNSEEFDSTPFYTDTFTSTVSQSTGKLEGIYVSDDVTRAMILLKFEDLSKLSTDVNNYNVFVTATDQNYMKRDMSYIPAGAIYWMGSTGYVGIYLANPSGFPSEMLHVVLQNNKAIGGEVGVADQIEMYVNLGATGTVPLDALSADKLSIHDFWAEVISSESEIELKQALEDDLVEMNGYLTAANEYLDRLDRAGVQVSGMIPDYVSGDSITLNGDGDLVLYTTKRCKGALDFNWRADNAKDGYYKDIQDGDVSISQFLTSMMSVEETPSRYSDDDWRMKDGTLVDDAVAGSTSSVYTSIASDIDLLEKAWSDYCEAKVRYQSTDRMPLLMVELDLIDASNNYTCNASENAIIVW